MPEESLFEKLSGKFEKLSGEIGGKETKNNKKLDLRAASRAVASYKKRIFLGIGALIIVILLIFIVPNIPLQLKRSAGFSALENGDYATAYEELSAYLNDRPNDYQATYNAARAALYLGETGYASNLLNNLYARNPGGAPDLPFYYALVNASRAPDDAVRALDNLLAQNANHVGGRFLRGWLLRNSTDSLRKAREDFLFVDEAVRQSDSDFTDILFLNRQLQAGGGLSVNFPPVKFSSSTARASALSNALGIDIGLSGHITRYQLSNEDAFIDDSLSANAVVAVYFSYMLMVRGETEEAMAELREPQMAFPDSLQVKQAAAFLRVREGDFAAAAEAFADIAEEATTDSRTLSNLAISRTLLGGDDAIQSALDLYTDVLTADPINAVALNNSAYLQMMRGNYDDADRLLVDASNDEKKTVFNRGLIKLLRDDFDSAIDTFSSLPEQDFPNIGRFIAEAHVGQKNYDKAIEIYRRYEKNNPTDLDLLLGKVKIIENSGAWRIAFNALQQFTDREGKKPEIEYRLGVLAARLGETAIFERQKESLLELGGEDNHYYQSLLAREHQTQGNINAAIAAIAAAMAAAPTARSAQEYAAYWAHLLLQNPEGTAAATVAATLQALLKDAFNEDLVALLGFALAESAPAKAIELIDSLPKDSLSFTSQIYAGAALAKIGDYRDALPLLQKAKEWIPTHVPLLEILREAQDNSGDAEAAKKTADIIDYLRLVALGEGPPISPKYSIFVPKGTANLGKSIQNAVRNKNAADKVQDVFKTYDNEIKKEDDLRERARLSYSRATFFAYLNRYDDATANFQTALASGLLDKDEQIKALAFYAKVLSQDDRHEEAIKAMDQLLELADAPLYRRERALLLASTQKLQAGIDALYASLARYPADLEAYYDLAKMQYALEDKETAEKTLKQLLRIAPDYAPAYKYLVDIYNEQGRLALRKEYMDAYSSLTTRQSNE